MEVEKVSYPDALRYLAKKFQIDVEEESQNPDAVKHKEERESLYIISDFAKEHYKNLLFDSDEGKSVGLSYFKERGFLLPVVKKFELGYALDEWDNLLKTALAKGFKEDLLEKCGLLVRKDAQKVYDRFRGRVIFPIHNATGRTVAFGARTLKKDEKPKYINSPESEIYHKSEHLYGIFQAKDAVRKADECFLVEGYTDVISMHEAGIENVVASSGTSLTEGQIKLIKRYTDNITVLFDGDNAGVKASLRGIDMLLEADMNVHACILPEGNDPDSFAKKNGSDFFVQFVKQNAKDFITFKSQIVLGDAGNDPIKRAQAIGEIVESIVKIPDAIKRSSFFRLCSQHFGISEEILMSEGNKMLAKKNKNKAQPKNPHGFEAQGQAIPDFYAEFPDGNFAPADNFGEEQYIPDVGFSPADISAPHKTVVQDSINFLHLQEEEIVRLLVCYGHIQLSEELNTAQYLLSELEEIEFENSVFLEAVVWYKAIYETGVIPDSEKLMQHENSAVRNCIAGMYAQKYELSENWTKMFDIPILKEEDLLNEVLYVNILRFKHLFLKKLINEKHQSMLKTETEEELMNVMREYTQLKNLEMQIAALLGTVISGKF
jgi:DNA primase